MKTKPPSDVHNEKTVVILSHPLTQSQKQVRGGGRKKKKKKN